MFCTNCGQELVPGAKFCSSCGHTTPGQTAGPDQTAGPGNTKPIPRPDQSAPIPRPGDTPTSTDPATAPMPATSGTDQGSPFGPLAETKRAPVAGSAGDRLHLWLAAARPMPAQLSADARNLAMALGLQLLCCLGITLLVSMLLPSGHHGSVVDWLRGMVVLGGASQRGAITADLSASILKTSGQVSASMTAPPLLLTAVIVVLLAVLLRRSERGHPSRSAQVASVRTLISAAGYALAWALLAVLARGQLGYGAVGNDVTAGATVGLSFWSMLGHGLLLATLVGGAVRLYPGLRSSSASWERLADARHALTAAATLTVLSWAAAVVVGVGWVVYTASASSDQPLSQGLSAPVENISSGQVQAGVAALLVMAALVANIVMIGGTFMLGNAVGYSGDGGGVFASEGLQSHSVGIFLGGGSPWWYLAPLLLWLAALLLGARAGGRFDPAARGGRALAHYVGAAVLTSLAVAAMTRFMLSVSVTGSTAEPSRSASYSAALGTGWESSLLIGVIIGLLMWCGHRFLLPELAAGYPRQLAGALGRRMHPAWALALADATVRSGQTPQLWLARMADEAAHLQVRPIHLVRRRLMLLGRALGVLVILVGGIAVGHHWLSGSVFGPASTVQTFIDAQAHGDSAAALGTLSNPPKSSTVGSVALGHQLARHPITGVTVRMLDVGDDSGTARVTYRQDGKAVERTLTVGVQANSARFLGFYPKWLIVDGALTDLAVETEGNAAVLGEVKVLGQSVDPVNGPFPVFHGPVDVTAAGSATVQPVESTLDLSGTDSSRVATLSATLRTEAAAAADTAVREALSDCVAQKSLAPVGCPFSTSTYGDPPLNVRWSMTADPQVAVSLDDAGQMRVDGSVDLRVDYVQQSEFSSSTNDSEEVTADLGGSAVYDGKTASVTFDTGNSTAGTD